MSGKVKVALFVVGVSALLFAGIAPAFATDGCPPPPKECLNPRGQITGWVPCGEGDCKNPTGERNGWVPCGNGCCMIPKGQLNGWEPCGDN